MKKDEIKQKRPFAPGIQWQLMLFIGGITLFTLLLVWGIITYALEPQYNRNIRAKLDSKAAAITALIDQSDAEISPFGSGFPLQVLAMLWAFPCNP